MHRCHTWAELGSFWKLITVDYRKIETIASALNSYKREENASRTDDPVDSYHYSDRIEHTVGLVSCYMVGRIMGT